jgi:hypothetical protein
MRLEPRLFLAVFGLSLAAVAAGAPAPAFALDRCTIGQRVLTPGREPATVIAHQGSGCTVRRDRDGLTDTYAAFMLNSATPQGQGPTPSPAPNLGTVQPQSPPPARSSTGSPAAGTYQCTSSTSGNLVVRIMPGNRYADRNNVAGAFTVNPGGQIGFVNGPLTGMYGRVLAGGRLGLTSNPEGSFYAMTCDRRS